MRYTVSEDNGVLSDVAEGRLAAIAIAKSEAVRLQVHLHVRDSREDKLIGTACPSGGWETVA